MVDPKIVKIKALQVLDSRGNPTIQAEVYTKEFSGSAIVPSGMSKSQYEAKELRDNTKIYHGLSVLKAINNITKISKVLIGKDVRNQEIIDNSMIKLDGTEDKSNLGGNAILAVSLAAARCSANLQNKDLYKLFNKKAKLPIPFTNVINGGKHASNDLKLQEFMIVPVNAKSFSQATQMIVETYQSLKNLIHLKYANVNVGDEGGFSVNSAEEALNLIQKSIELNSYEKNIKIAIDAAASEFYNSKKNNYEVEANKELTKYTLIDYYSNLIKNYKIISIEDPFDQNDFAAWQEFNKKVKIQLVADDLTSTNPKRIQEATKEKLANCLLLKPNQIGTLTESIEAFNLASKEKWNCMISHRSGDSEDTFIADLAVGLGTGQIKLGAPCRGERTAKYNRLLKIEEESNLKYSKF